MEAMDAERLIWSGVGWRRGCRRGAVREMGMDFAACDEAPSRWWGCTSRPATRRPSTPRWRRRGTASGRQLLQCCSYSAVEYDDGQWLLLFQHNRVSLLDQFLLKEYTLEQFHTSLAWIDGVWTDQQEKKGEEARAGEPGRKRGVTGRPGCSPTRSIGRIRSSGE